MTSLALAPTGRRDVEVISLIGAGHFFAHFYILALPPLFPLLTVGLGFSYAELGLGLAVLNLATGLAQVPIGMLVDRYGAFWPLLLGQACFALGIGLVALAPGYPVFLCLMALAGLGNAVFHPADYAILAGSVSRGWLGRGFAVHTFGGYLGFAAAPAVLLPLSGWLGWQFALGLSALAGLAFAGVLIAFRHHLASEQATAPGTAPMRGGSTLRLFLGWPVAMAFLFFALISAGQGGFSNFGTATLEQLPGIGLAQAGLPVFLYLAASAVGVLLGGQIADRTSRHGLVVAVCFGSITLVALLLTLPSLGLVPVTLLFVLAGLFGGAVSPSRDLMVKQITPAGASGRVFGFVTIGFNVGTLASAPLFGHLLDLGMARGVFWLVAAISLASIVTILGSRGAGRDDPRVARSGGR
ncbi:MAG TPA: MFS transporter [Geminicoccus sp.]|uniref:MFS transporter n=1 Tax=Geminicoccus sp. TaxID=2024832 RepID=UPI002C60A54C|nr:MFS transporter [Geminicoccus sp.]HWL72095.1 MFS transporter [Geminicoccus sp.]